MTDDLSRDVVSQFVDDDEAYLQWIDANPNGFILNCARKPKDNYLVLHRAICSHLSTPARKNWTADYIKVCSNDASSLKRWATEAADGEVTLCQVCKPDAL